MLDNTINMNTLKTTDLIDKINNVVRLVLSGEISDNMQNTLVGIFARRKDLDNWKNAISPIEFTFTFRNYEKVIKAIGLLSMAYAHFHGGYELSRIGNTDTVEISSKGYYYYQEDMQ